MDYAPLKERFPGGVLSVAQENGQDAIEVTRDAAHDVLKALRDEHGFDMLVDVCGVDYLKLDRRERFAAIYHLLSTGTKARVRVRAFVPESDPRIATASDLWPGAGWPERETYDLYGIVFTGHRDPRRILMPEGYEGHPLRKDYPLKGRGEREDFPRYEAVENVVEE